MDFVKNQDINQYYTFQQEIGNGNFATVYKAVHQQTGEDVAIKRIFKIQEGEKYDVNLIKNECGILIKLDHDNIVAAYEVYQDANSFYIVMEYVQGKDVDDRIISQGIRGEHKIWKIIISMVNALQFIHSLGIVHRDLKPQNILVTTFDEFAQYKLTDFGTARQVSSGDVLTTACGTPNYFAPQIIEGLKYSKSVDYWSLGVLMYHLLSGSVPFKSQNVANQIQLFERIKTQSVTFPSNPWDNISQEAKDLIHNLLQKNPDYRYTIQQIRKHPWIKAQGNCKH